MTFRHPSLLARMAAQLDQLSGGRFVLGVGAGWNVGEHEAFGLPFPSLRERMDRLEEGIQVVLALLGDEPATFEGRYYQLHEALSYPKPLQRPLPLLIGGRGERRTLQMAARYAQEWNFAGIELDEYRRLAGVLARHCDEAGRDPADVRHSQMAGFVIGRDEAEQRAHLERIAVQAPALVQQSFEETLPVLAARGWLIGTPDAIVEQIGRLRGGRDHAHHAAAPRNDGLRLPRADRRAGAAAGPALTAEHRGPPHARDYSPATTVKRPLSLRPKTSGKNVSSAWVGATKKSPGVVARA